MKKIPSVFFVFLLSVGASTSVHAQSRSLSTYNISPRGNYNYIRLIPKNGGITMGLGQACTGQEGTIYLNKESGRLLLCQNNTWKPISDVWKEDGTVVSPADPAPTDIRVGIGTMTPEFKLTLDGDGSILARGAAGGTAAALPQMKWANFLWYPRKAALWAGSFSQTVADADIGLYSVNLGYSLQTKNQGSTAYGGCSDNSCGCSTGTIPDNCANSGILGQSAAIGGGFNNSAPENYVLGTWEGGGTLSSLYPTVAGGLLTTAEGTGSFAGGCGSLAHGEYATVLCNEKGDPDFSGSSNNYPDHAGPYSFVGGGAGGGGAEGHHSVVLGGRDHEIFGSGGHGAYSVIGGGNSHLITGDYSIIFGGAPTFPNTITNDYAVIGGGKRNEINSESGTILGGELNKIIASVGYQGFIAGGYSNEVGADRGTIFAGYDNSISGVDSRDSFIGGGKSNEAAGRAAVVGGGEGNHAADWQSFVGGGKNNRAGGNSSVVPGGENNIADGDYSLAAGRNIRLDSTATGSFAWGIDGDSSDTDVSEANRFIIFPDAEGRAGIGTNNPQSLVHIVSASNVGLRIRQGKIVIQSPSGSTGSNLKSSNRILGHQDLAETFTSSEDVEPGDVLALDEGMPGKLKRSALAYNRKVVGVVSTSPAILFEGSRMQVSPKPFEFTKGTKPPVALKGRVLLKVSLENGPIEAGDVLTTSSTPGHAMKSTDILKEPGAIIGKALAPFKGGAKGETTGLIPVFVALH